MEDAAMTAHFVQTVVFCGFVFWMFWEWEKRHG
jgi:hypothetical protein